VSSAANSRREGKHNANDKNANVDIVKLQQRYKTKIATDIRQYLGFDISDQDNIDLNFDIKDYKWFEENIIRVKKNLSEVKKLFGFMNDTIEGVNNGIKQLSAFIYKTELKASKICLGEKDTIWKNVATLEKGDAFGELALMSKKGTRQARVTALSYCNMGVIHADDFTNCLLKLQKESKDKLVDFIQGIPFFKNISKNIMMKVTQSLNQETCIKGQLVTVEDFTNTIPKKQLNFEDNSSYSDHSIYIILSGEFAAI
jgi:hypothetical protein